MTTTTYQLETLTCPSCINRIEGALKNQPGVESVKVLFNASKVRISHDESADTAQSKQTIKKLGYEVLDDN